MAHIERRSGKRGVSYRVRYTDPTGVERSRTFRRKAEATDFVTETTHRIRAGTYVDPALGRQTVRAYLEGWRAVQAHHRPKTAASTATRFRTMVYPYLGDLPVGSLRPSTIRQWQVDLLAAGYSPSTITGVRGQLSGALRAAVRERILVENPCEGVRSPEVVRERVVPRTVAQVIAGEAAMPARYRAMIPFLAGTGLRAGEVWGLTVDRVDFEKATVLVDRQLIGRAGRDPVFGPPKTPASVREVPLPARAIAALKRHLEAYPPIPGAGWWQDGPTKRVPVQHAGLVFATARGTPLTRTVFARAWKPAAAAMGLDAGKGLHQLRHFYASLLIAAGRSVVEVRDRLGHATADETLNTYGHLFEDSAEGTRWAVDSVFDAQSPDGPE